MATARNDIIPFLQGVWVNLHQEWGDDAIHTKALQMALWKASTEMLPNLEVQIVIDGENKAHISSGSAGYVSFLKNPVGLKLPIKCWFHTHPFGSAYFSGTDWGTVIPWTPLMKCAYVVVVHDCAYDETLIGKKVCYNAENKNFTYEEYTFVRFHEIYGVVE